jgi:hypothetical protein
MDYLRGFLIAGLLGLAGTGGALIIENLNTGSPRLMAGGIAAAAVGFFGGGLALGRSFSHADSGTAFHQRGIDGPPRRRDA